MKLPVLAVWLSLGACVHASRAGPAERAPAKGENAGDAGPPDTAGGIRVVTGVVKMGDGVTFRCDARSTAGGVVVNVYAQPRCKTDSPATVVIEVASFHRVDEYAVEIPTTGDTYPLLPFPMPEKLPATVHTFMRADCANPRTTVSGSSTCLLEK